MKLNGFVNELEHFLARFSRGDTARKVRYVRAIRLRSLLHNYEITHVLASISSNPPASEHCSGFQAARQYWVCPRPSLFPSSRRVGAADGCPSSGLGTSRPLRGAQLAP